MPPWPVPKEVRASTLVAIPNEVRQAALRSRKLWWDDLPSEFKENPRKKDTVINPHDARRMRIRMMRHGVMFPWEEPQLPMWHMWCPMPARSWDMSTVTRGKKIEEGMAKMPDLIAEFRESRRNIRKEKRNFIAEEKQRERMEEAASYTLANLRQLLDHYDESDFAWSDHFKGIMKKNPEFKLPEEIQPESLSNYQSLMAKRKEVQSPYKKVGNPL